MELKDLFTGAGAPKVSAVGLGANNFGVRCDAAQSAAVVHAALDCGINFFDTADIYGGGGASEEYLGKALGARRSTVFVATKFGMSTETIRGGGAGAYVISAAEDSLKRLGTDYIDLYQYHKPDPEIAMAETLEALDRLVRDGKVRHVGCSNLSAAQLEEALAISANGDLAPFVTAQNPYSLLDRNIEAGLVAACTTGGIGILPYYPLARGLLTGKYRRAAGALTDKNFDIVEPLDAFAASHGHSLLELAFSWLAAQPTVPCVIAGATRPEQVHANAGAAEWKLNAEDLAEIDRITQG